ncbi:hypothetical protein M9H77_26558 [Catharanthus roseus]|uniref:Uncharacterized protein n=1 Tax=Catharanthus roseus TaxID=4058 RepID=A0ACC0ABK1_CATRO|nr:hypothetical protein M9H77_26558 [Catharanthus roseus]
MVSDNDNYSDSYIYRSIYGEDLINGEESLTNGEREGSDIQNRAEDTGDLTIESSDDIDKPIQRLPSSSPFLNLQFQEFLLPLFCPICYSLERILLGLCFRRQLGVLNNELKRLSILKLHEEKFVFNIALEDSL